MREERTCGEGGEVREERNVEREEREERKVERRRGKGGWLQEGWGSETVTCRKREKGKERKSATKKLSNPFGKEGEKECSIRQEAEEVLHSLYSFCVHKPYCVVLNYRGYLQAHILLKGSINDRIQAHCYGA